MSPALRVVDVAEDADVGLINRLLSILPVKFRQVAKARLRQEREELSAHLKREKDSLEARATTPGAPPQVACCRGCCCGARAPRGGPWAS